MMSREQREKLSAFVDKEYGEVLASNIGVTSANTQIFVIQNAQQQQQASDIEVDDALKEILSEPQLEIWKTEFQKDLDSLDDK